MFAIRPIGAVLTVVVLASAQTRPAAVGHASYTSEVYVASADFTQARIVGLAKDVLQREPMAFVSVWFFASEGDAASYRNGKLSDHTRYDTWYPSYDHLRDLKPLARLVSIAGSAILLFRGADGTVSKRVLGGGNPLEITLRFQQEVHLIDLILSPRSYQSNEHAINVFAWTPEALTEDLGQGVIADMRSKLPFPEISLFVRHDPWFIDETEFPAFPPFVPEFAPPDREKYIVSPTLVCGKRVGAESYHCIISDRHN